MTRLEEQRRIAELELQLGLRTNYPKDQFLYQEKRPLIREWLGLIGVPEDNIATMSPTGLNNAYGAGRQWVEKNLVNPTVRTTRHGRIIPQANKPKLNLSFGEDPEVQNLINQNGFGAAPTVAPQTPETTITQPEAELLQEAGFQTTLDAVKRAAEAIIPPRLSAISAQLYSQLNAIAENKIAEMAASATISENLRSQILTLAQEFVETLSPRRIEIKTNVGIRTLSAEPRHKKFEDILGWLLAGENVYIVGPAGTGKTHLFKQLANAIGKKQWSIGQSLTKYDLSGYKSPTGEYIGTLLREALEVGGLVTIDEGDMWAAAALGFLNQPLANGYCAFPDKIIEVHPDFQCIIAANTYGHGANSQYIGRNPLDGASLDRFAYEEVDYDEDLERLLYGNGPWTQYVQRVRKAVAELKLTHIVSMRATLRCIRGAEANKTPESIAQSALWRGLSQDSINKIQNLAGKPPRPENPIYQFPPRTGTSL